MLSRNIRKSFWTIALPSKSWAPYEAGTQNKWPCGRLRRSERLDRAVQAGQTRKVLKYVEQRQVMVASYKFCNERPEQRAGVRCMMQSLDDVFKLRRRVDAQLDVKPWPFEIAHTETAVVKAGWETFSYSALMSTMCSICLYLGDLHGFHTFPARLQFSLQWP